MGQRCNLVITENGHSTLYYDHWAANRLDGELFWGPELARSFIEARSPAPESWLDDVWAEGGAVVDFDAKRLLWYGGEDIRYDAGLNLAHAKLMAKQWLGWNIDWANEGIFDIARAAGASLARVSSDKSFDPPPLATEKFDDDDYYADAVASASIGDRTLYGIICGTPSSLALPETKEDTITQLIARFDKTEFLRKAKADPEWEVVKWGVHVEPMGKRMDIWFAHDVPGLSTHIAKRWPGWQVNLHGPEFRWHGEHVPDDLLPDVTPTKERQVLLHLGRLLDMPATNPTASVVEALRRRGESNIQVNPATAQHREGSVQDAAIKLGILRNLEHDLP